jgi:hypothetical protein
MDKVREIPEIVLIDWEEMIRRIEAGDTYKGPPIEIKIDFDKIKEEMNESMKCVAIVPQRK